MNLYIALIGFSFFLMQNNYFGWNAMPKSDAELLADGITMLLFALAVKTP